MLNAGKDLAAVLQALEVSEATYHLWRNQCGKRIRIGDCEVMQPAQAYIEQASVGTPKAYRFNATALKLDKLRGEEGGRRR